MFHCKKSILGKVATMLFAVTFLHADYIPLTDSAGNDESWVLFGVTGLKTAGAGAGTSAGTFSIANNVANVAVDATQDELFTEGLLASTGESLAKVKVLPPYAQVEIRIDTDGAVFHETEPVRTIYVAMNEGEAPAFAVSYRASLEGHTMEYSVNPDGSNAHTLVIDSANIYNNPAVGEVIQEIAGIAGSYLDRLADLVDYDFTNNPVNFEYYDRDLHRDTAGAGEYLRVYSYRADTETWELYDSRNTSEANDFEKLEKGKAYWAKMKGNGKVAGLILGSSSVSATDYAAAGIIEGWNLIAFDEENPYIRKSETGLLLEIKNSGDITIYDSSANHSVTVAIDNTSLTTINSSCKAINNTIKQDKIKGTIPDTFDLKAFAVDATHVVLISNKRFIVEDSSSDVVGAVETLANQIPYSVNPANLTVTSDTAAITDLGTGASSAMSKYGEYSLIFEPTYAAQAQGAAKIHVQSTASDATAVNAIALGTNIAGTVTATDNVDIGGYNSFSRAIDIDYDGTVDHVLISSVEPFYIRDHTFTRVFKYTDTDVSGTAYIRGTGSNADITLADTTDDATAAAAAFDGNGNVVAAVDPLHADQFVVISHAANANEFTITESTETDHLTDAITTSDLAKGAVKGVYSLSSLVANSTMNTITFSLATPDDAADTTQTTLKSTIGSESGDDAAVTVGSSSVSNDSNWAVEYKAHLEALLASSNISATVTTAVSGGGGSIDVAIASIDILDIKVARTGGEPDINYGSANVDVGKLSSVAPDLTADLRFNAIYTPNYVVDGPLYSMKEAGFSLQALVTGTTDLSDGSINWDSIDLTRTPADWLDSQDYNLFQVSEKSGYWAYLAADAQPNPLSISSAKISPLLYTYHFNAINPATGIGANDSHISGNIELIIDGLDTDTRAVPVVSVSIAGSVIELSNVAGGNAYTGKVSSYEIATMDTGYNYEILANIADGLGNNLKSFDTGLRIDYIKPSLPTINLGDGAGISLSSSDDVAGYYIYKGQIPELDTATASNLLVRLPSDQAAAYALCSANNISKLSWDEAPYDLHVIAVDGEGILGKGNVSDANTKKYVPMLKDAVLLVDSANSDSDAAILGTIFDNACTQVGAQTQSYGVTLTSETDLQTVKLAYKPENVTDLTATPVTLFVKSSNGGVDFLAKITYASVYEGKEVYIELGGQVYSLLLPTEDEISGDDTGGSGPRYGGAGVGASVNSPLDLNDGIDDLPSGDQHGYAELQEDQSL